MKKVYLISPPAGEERKGYPLSLMYLHSHLLKNGFGSEVLDCDVLGWNVRHLVNYLSEKKAEIVGITGYSFNRFHAYQTIKEIKSRLPECKIIVGGRHFSALATEALERLKEIDYVVRGEGEITLKELCDAVSKNKSLNNVLGITFRDNGKIISNPDRPVTLDLDSLHYNLDDFFALKGNYSLAAPVSRLPNVRAFSVFAGRGCPGCCVFCSLSSQRMRLRNVESVLDEIQRLLEITGIRHVSFGDPTLTASSKYLVDLCEGILRRNLNIKWNCYSRVDVSPQIFELMKRAGCTSVDIALESASPRVLQAIKKYIKVEDALKCVKKLRELKIRSFIFAMIGLPEEREEDAEMTLRFLEDISDLINGAALAITQIFPDAALYYIAKEKKILPPGFDWFSAYYNPYYSRHSIRSTAPFYIEHLSMDYINHMKNRFEKLQLEKFYNKYDYRFEMRKALAPKALVPLIFDWRNQTLSHKVRKIKKGLTRLPYVLKSMGNKNRTYCNN